MHTTKISEWRRNMACCRILTCAKRIWMAGICGMCQEIILKRFRATRGVLVKWCVRGMTSQSTSTCDDCSQLWPQGGTSLRAHVKE